MTNNTTDKPSDILSKIIVIITLSFLVINFIRTNAWLEIRFLRDVHIKQIADIMQFELLPDETLYVVNRASRRGGNMYFQAHIEDIQCPHDFLSRFQRIEKRETGFWRTIYRLHLENSTFYELYLDSDDFWSRAEVARIEMLPDNHLRQIPSNRLGNMLGEFWIPYAGVLIIYSDEEHYMADVEFRLRPQDSPALQQLRNSLNAYTWFHPLIFIPLVIWLALAGFLIFRRIKKVKQCRGDGSSVND